MGPRMLAVRLSPLTKIKCQFCGHIADCVLFIADDETSFRESYQICLDCAEEYSTMIYGTVPIPKGFIFDGFLNM